MKPQEPSSRTSYAVLYTHRLGHPMLRARHLLFSIGDEERDQWMAWMIQAMEER